MPRNTYAWNMQVRSNRIRRSRRTRLHKYRVRCTPKGRSVQPKPRQTSTVLRPPPEQLRQAHMVAGDAWRRRVHLRKGFGGLTWTSKGAGDGSVVDTPPQHLCWDYLLPTHSSTLPTTRRCQGRVLGGGKMSHASKEPCLCQQTETQV